MTVLKVFLFISMFAQFSQAQEYSHPENTACFVSARLTKGGLCGQGVLNRTGQDCQFSTFKKGWGALAGQKDLITYSECKDKIQDFLNKVCNNTIYDEMPITELKIIAKFKWLSAWHAGGGGSNAVGKSDVLDYRALIYKKYTCGTELEELRGKSANNGASD